MGAFGTQSHSNDTSWDVLGRYARDGDGGFPGTQAEADLMLAWIAADFAGGTSEDRTYWRSQHESESVLGPIVWCLREGFTVPKPLLERAITIARSTRMDRAYMECWVDVEERDTALVEEIVMLKRAIKAIA